MLAKVTIATSLKLCLTAPIKRCIDVFLSWSRNVGPMVCTTYLHSRQQLPVMAASPGLRAHRPTIMLLYFIDCIEHSIYAQTTDICSTDTWGLMYKKYKRTKKQLYISFDIHVWMVLTGINTLLHLWVPLATFTGYFEKGGRAHANLFHD